MWNTRMMKSMTKSQARNNQALVALFVLAILFLPIVIIKYLYFVSLPACLPLFCVFVQFRCQWQECCALVVINLSCFLCSRWLDIQGAASLFVSTHWIHFAIPPSGKLNQLQDNPHVFMDTFKRHGIQVSNWWCLAMIYTCRVTLSTSHRDC